MRKLLLSLLLLMLTCLQTFSQVSEFAPNVLEHLFQEHSVRKFNSLLLRGNVDGILLEHKELTIFVPVNEAFKDRVLQEIEAAVPSKRLMQQFVESHIINQRIELRHNISVKSISGITLQIRKVGFDYYIGDAKILKQVDTSDGKIYYVDKILKYTIDDY